MEETLNPNLPPHDETKWVWCVGVVNSIGECAFQMPEDQYGAPISSEGYVVRRLTPMILQQRGPKVDVSFRPLLLDMAKTSKTGEWAMVPTALLYYDEASEELVEALDRLWGEKVIIPANGQKWQRRLE